MDRLLIADSLRTGEGVRDDSVLISDGRIAATGPADELRRPGLAEDRYPGTTILPGLIDAHFHPVGYTASVVRLNVEKAASHVDLVDSIRSYATNLPPAQPVIGTRLNEQSMEETQLPDRQLLDEADAERPLLLYRYDGHVAIANTAALALAGVDAATLDPNGGRIERDSSGVPTGILKETAIDLVADELGGRAADLTAAEVLATLQDLRSMGLTRLGAIASLGQGLFCGGARELDVLCDIGRDLPLYLDVLIITDDPAELEAAADRIRSVGTPRLNFLGVKIFGDGSFGGRTAAMSEPFADRDTIGVDRLDPAVHGDVAQSALDMGGMVAVHAIGDRANANVLDLYERLLDRGADPAKLRIEHVSVLLDSDFDRMASLGVTASVQPAFLGSEHDWLDTILTPDQIRRTYAFNTMQSAGIRMAGGSDCPVEPPPPLSGMAAAIHRYGHSQTERLSFDAALTLFTVGAASALASDQPLEAGAPANLTIVEGDPATADPALLASTEVVATWIDGEPR